MKWWICVKAFQVCQTTIQLYVGWHLLSLEGNEGGDGGGIGGANGGAQQAISEREWLQALCLQVASLRGGLEAQTRIQGHLETQERARNSRAMLANFR
jgi:hypothetical protein